MSFTRVANQPFVFMFVFLQYHRSLFLGFLLFLIVESISLKRKANVKYFWKKRWRSLRLIFIRYCFALWRCLLNAGKNEIKLDLNFILKYVVSKKYILFTSFYSLFFGMRLKRKFVKIFESRKSRSWSFLFTLFTLDLRWKNSGWILNVDYLRSH